MRRTAMAWLVVLGCTPSGGDESGGDDSADSDVDSDTEPFEPPEWCPPVEGGNHDVTETPASPYWLSQPAADATGVETILFLPGGPGDRGSADNNFVAFFARHPEFVQSRRVATMYSTEGPMTSVWPRAHDVAAELVACFGVPAGTVHLMGHSNGGAAVWSVIQNDPSPYKTLLAAPGSWGGLPSDATLRDIFGTRPVYLGVGANDGGSRPGVQSVYDKLLSLDLEVTLDVWAGEGHVPGPDFDPAELYAFIDAH